MKTYGIRGVLICIFLVSPSLAEPPIPVVCPAVDHVSDYPELVLVVREYKKSYNEGQYQVVRVLYGSYGEQTIRVTPYYPPDRVGGKQWPKVGSEFIIALTSPEYWRRSRYKACYRLPLSEERAEAALCRARLDYAALASSCIFIGERAGFSSVEDFSGNLTILNGQLVEPIRADDDKPKGYRITSRIVDVEHVIHGDSLWPQQRITTNEDVPSDFKRLTLDSASQIFFVSPIEQNQLNTIYRVFTHLPVDLESEVRQALERLKKYPVVENCDKGILIQGDMWSSRTSRASFDDWKDKVQDDDEEQPPCDYFPKGMESLPKISNGPPAKRREIVFLGSDAEAIELLGTSSEGAATLFYRTLYHRRETARSKVVAAIERDMFSAFSPADELKGYEYQRLNRLIDLLGDMQRKDGGDDLERLVDMIITHIERDAPTPSTNGKWSDWEETELSDETNHALIWLLKKLDRRECCEKFGDRLAALRLKATDQWRKEVQLAADAMNLDDNMKITAAMTAMKNAKPVRSSSGLRHIKNSRLDAVAFSHDGKLLATSGDGGIIQIWNTADWSCKVTIEQGRTKRLVFSPDDKFLYAAGGDENDVFARFDPLSGKLNKTYSANDADVNLSAMELSPDGRTMATIAYGDEYANYRALNFWDTDSGKIVRNIRVQRHESCLYPSPNGRGIVRPVGRDKSKRWVFEPFRGRGGTKVAVPNNIWPGYLTPAVGDLVYGCYRETETFLPDLKIERAGCVFRGCWTKKGLNIHKSKKAEILEIRDPIVSPDGKLLAAVGRRGEIQLFSLPEMNVLGKYSPNYIYASANEKPLAFSPDGKILAVASIAPSPVLIRTDTLKQFTPYEGHLTKYPDIYFDADGKRLRTIGEENRICTWDLETMKMLGRIELPAEFHYAGARDSDGRYLICSKVRREIQDEKGNGPLLIIDSDSGEIVAETNVPNGCFYWINDHEALCLDFPTETEADVYRFDCKTGDVLNVWKSSAEPDSSHVLYNDYFWDWTKDGRLYCFIYDFDNPFVEGEYFRTAVFNPATGRFDYNPNRIALSDFSPATEKIGLVPGGEYFYLIAPGVAVYDRDTLQPVWKDPLTETFIGQFAFSDDGKRLAVSTTDSYSLPWKDVIRIYDVETGKLLYAFAPEDYCNGQIKFSHDGRRLALVNEDGTISVWILPGGK